MIKLSNDRTEILILPEHGGAVAAFRWNGHDIFRPAHGITDILRQGNFPLIPFSGRIANGQFEIDGRQVKMPPNLPDSMHPHAIHGFGWQSSWSVIKEALNYVTIRHEKNDGVWPWHYVAEQEFRLSQDGYSHILRITNLSDDIMPAGMGLHPYFPRKDAQISIQIDGLWEISGTGIPTNWSAITDAPNWFDGTVIDHAFTGRHGHIHIEYPEYTLAISPADGLKFTVIYIPPGEDYFCVEPVSHMPDAVNRVETADITGIKWLKPGEGWSLSTNFSLSCKN